MQKTAVVTGSAGGIGRAYAEALAADGVSVVVADINLPGAEETAAGITSAGGTAVAHPVDVSDVASAAELAGFVGERFGRLDILVNNAAFFGGMKLVSAMHADIEYWRRIFRINLDGILIVTQALGPLLRDGSGRIVNQSSTAAYMGGGDPYSVCKAAVTALTMGLASEMGARGITVNAIAPGPVPTEAMKSVVPDTMLEGIAQRTPIARLGTTDDMVHALRSLVADAAGWITGQTLIVDGGMVRRF